MFYNFFFETRAVYEIMWKNIVEPEMPQMTIWRMRIESWVPKATHTNTHIHTHNLIYKDECLYGTYTNPHFWTDLNQTLHTYPPWSGEGRRVRMDPQYFNFPTFSTYFVGSECRFVLRRWLSARGSPIISRVGVTSRTWRAPCVMHWNRREVNGMHVCGNGNLMRRRGSE